MSGRAGEQLRREDAGPLPRAFSTAELIDGLRSYVARQDVGPDGLGDVFLWEDLLAGRIDRARYHDASGRAVLSGILQEKLSFPTQSDEERIRSVACARGRILDFGGGAGDVSLALAEAGFDVTYVDVNRECRRFADHIFAESGLTKSDSIEGRFNTVLALNVLDHLDDPLGALSEIHALLNPGGICILSLSFDGAANPVHVCDPATIDAVEDMLKTHFEEYDSPDRLDHHRLFRKRAKPLTAPVDRDGSLVLPPDGTLRESSATVALAGDIELVRHAGRWLLRHHRIPSRQWEATDTLARLLLRIETPTGMAALTEWAEAHYRCAGLADLLETILHSLWAQRIIKGWVA
jgi:SAM-dependent methyltransferase